MDLFHKEVLVGTIAKKSHVVECSSTLDKYMFYHHPPHRTSLRAGGAVTAGERVSLLNTSRPGCLTLLPPPGRHTHATFVQIPKTSRTSQASPSYARAAQIYRPATCTSLDRSASSPPYTMTEAEIATKAPESDAQEDVPLATGSTTTPAAATVEDEPEESAQPKMGEHCVTDRPTRQSSWSPLHSPLLGIHREP